MSLFLIILAAGDSKRLKSAIPKPFNTIKNNNYCNISQVTTKIIENT